MQVIQSINHFSERFIVEIIYGTDSLERLVGIHLRIQLNTKGLARKSIIYSKLSISISASHGEVDKENQNQHGTSEVYRENNGNLKGNYRSGRT